MSKFLDDGERYRGVTRPYTVVCGTLTFIVLANSGAHAYERITSSAWSCLPTAVFAGEHVNLITAYKTIRL